MNLTRIGRAVALLVCGFGLTASRHAQASLTDGLVAYYPFSGNANDASGNGNHGAVSGATLSLDRFGTSGNAYYFGGGGSHISVLDSPTLDTPTALTLSAWIKLEPGGLYQPRILHKHVFDLGLTDTSGTPQLFLNIQNYPSGGATLATSPLQPNEWMFLTGTYDQQTLRLYLNGAIAAEISSSVPIDVNNLPIGIGRNLESGTDWYKGFIDDIRIYNRALSSEEVGTLFQVEAVPEPSSLGLVAIGVLGFFFFRRQRT